MKIKSMQFLVLFSVLILTTATIVFMNYTNSRKRQDGFNLKKQRYGDNVNLNNKLKEKLMKEKLNKEKTGMKKFLGIK